MCQGVGKSSLYSRFVHVSVQVRVFHLEAISDPADSFPPPVYQPRRGDTQQEQQQGQVSQMEQQQGQASQLEQQQGQASQLEQQQGAPSMFADSIESLMRNIIQKQKIDMANEVIDAGRFDMQTTNEERRKTLEEMLLVSCCCDMVVFSHPCK
jgi:SWI/SNF-related matrix-associated actin-dependent regulator of chromatin subfamily A protein 2/4